MRAIVHIGLPKTGTTSFQRVLFEQHDELRRRDVHVLTYDGPDDQLALPTRAFDLANCVVRPDLDVWWRAYLPESALPAFVERGRTSIRRQVAAPEELLVASVEDLFLVRTDDEVDRLTTLLQPREVSVVLTVRDTDSWLRSLRVQLIAAGIRPFSNWEDSCSNLRPDSWMCDVDGLVELLSRHVGADRVTIVDYDREVERCGSVLPALWRACGLPAELLGGAGSDGAAWANPTRRWADAADPPAGSDDEIEWLRLRVLAQARELDELRRVVARLRGLARPVRRVLGRPRRAPRAPGSHR